MEADGSMIEENKEPVETLSNRIAVETCVLAIVFRLSSSSRHSTTIRTDPVLRPVPIKLYKGPRGYAASCV